MKTTLRTLTLLATVSALPGCLSTEAEGIARAQPARTTVKMDFLHKPLPEIPLPNDVATRYDTTSATGRRINASLISTTEFERTVREKLDQMDGWGVFQPISVPFTGELDPASIRAGHQDTTYDFSDDVIYLVNIDPASPELGKLHALDVGNGNYPPLLKDVNKYYKHDSRGETLALIFEETDEDTNGDGVLQAEEDTDEDGVLDRPNYFPGMNPAADDLIGRADALMTFYERESSTLIVRPLEPVRERTTYAVVVTRRILDVNGEPVGSPYGIVNHESQTAALRGIEKYLPAGTGLDDIAFAFSYTTQSLQSHWIAVRDGLYGHGVQKHLADTKGEVTALAKLRDTESAQFRGVKNPFVLPGEDFEAAYALVAQAFQGGQPNTVEFQSLMESNKYVDYTVIGYFDSPQLYPRGGDTPEAWVGLNEQSWPADLDRVPAPVRNERVWFHLTVPRKEVSVRKDGKPAPVVYVGHGYTGNRFSTVSIGGYLAQHGLAAVGIDCPTHGLSGDEEQTTLARQILSGFGLGPLIDAVFEGRAHDQNGDGVLDSGADFWTAYLFHTRDVVRQCALDHMQLARVLRGFDGTRKFAFDLNGDGQNELAGDFDADGVVDVGGTAEQTMLGGSLGGIMAVVLGGLEPALRTVVPVSAGGGLGEIALRSSQGGVPQSVVLRLMGPLFVGTLDPATGKTLVENIVPNLNDDATYPIGEIENLEAGDGVRVQNLTNGEVGCGRVSPEGTFRVGVASDIDDKVVVTFYPAGRFDHSVEVCALTATARPRAVLDTFGFDVTHQRRTWSKGEGLVAIEQGRGLSRATPELRRFMSLGQLVLDAADPAVYAKSMWREPIVYPGTGETTGSSMALLTTIGDYSVPTSGGASIARAAGLLNYTDVDPRWGKPQNQVLIDEFAMEGNVLLPRHRDTAGNSALMDVDVLSEGKDLYLDTVPRLEKPIRAGYGQDDPRGNKSVAFFVYSEPEGDHGFASPGSMTDKARRRCMEACAAEMRDPCECEDPWDIGYAMFNLAGRYLVTNGKELELKACHASDTCDYKPEPPARRSAAEKP